MRIIHIAAREVLDSRGRPTVECEVHLEGGAWGRAIVPSGASTGKHEALELRDKDATRFGGFGVRLAVNNIMQRIAPAVTNSEFKSLSYLDARLLELDPTPAKKDLGANALLAVSLAFAHACAAADKIPLYRYFAWMTNRRPTMPLPMINILSGGLHAGRQLDFQDFLIIPHGAQSIMQALEWTYAVYQAALRRCVATGYNRQLVADEGGLAPNLESNEAALEMLTESISEAGFTPGAQISIGIDVASTHFYMGREYRLLSENRSLTSEQMVEYLTRLVESYPILSIEDGLAEDDWDGWQVLTRRLGTRMQILGDDLFVTNCSRLEQGISRGVANAILIKFNQVGTLSETFAAVATAREAGYRTVISARSGETEDTTMADMAVGVAGGQIKVGSITRSSRLAKYNQLLRLSEDEEITHWLRGDIFSQPQVSFYRK